MKTKERFNCLTDMLHTEAYLMYEGETLLNPQYHMTNNTGVNVDKMLEANEAGTFGVSHRDFIDCWRDYLKNIELSDSLRKKITNEINEVEEYHEAQKTIDDII